MKINLRAVLCVCMVIIAVCMCLLPELADGEYEHSEQLINIESSSVCRFLIYEGELIYINSAFFSGSGSLIQEQT